MEPIGLVVFAAAFVAWMVTSVRPADDHQIAAMAEMYRVPLSEGVVVRLRRRVLILRRWRRFGAFAGVGVTGLVTAVSSAELTINALLFGIAIGYGVASVIGELWFARRRRPGEIASVRPRTIRDTIGVWAVLPALAAATIVVASLIVHWVWRPGDVGDASGLRTPIGDGTLIVAAVAFVLVVAGAVTVVRLLVIAPERGSAVEDHVVQRASRVVSIMTVIGATWMLVGVIGSVVIQPLWNVRIENGLLSFLRFMCLLYVALSVMFGFISTVSTLPRNRWFRSRRERDTPLPMMSGRG